MRETHDLIKKLKAEFPNITFKKACLIKKGWDHDVLILDNNFVVRFAKAKLSKDNFEREVKFLKDFSKISNLPVPHYQFYSKKKSFGGYTMIEGKELTPALYKKLSPAKKRNIIKELATFITLLHKIPLKKARAYGFRYTGYEGWEKALKEKRTWFESEFFPKVSSHLSAKQNAFINKFLDYFCTTSYSITPVLGHFDLSHDHIIMNNNGTISGIIDFGDVSISDPAHEFNGFWDYDSKLPSQIYKLYCGPKDANFLRRCRDHYIHRWIYLLYDGLIRRKNPSLFKEANGRINSIMKEYPNF